MAELIIERRCQGARHNIDDLEVPARPTNEAIVATGVWSEPPALGPRCT